MECRIVSRRLWLVFFLFISGSFVCLETQGITRKGEVILLLEDSLTMARVSLDSTRRAMTFALSQRDMITAENLRLKEENRRLVFAVQDAERNAKHLEQTNAMFVWYIGIAAIVFLITLLFIVVRKLYSKPNSMHIPASGQGIDRKIERLNALGDLRERGLLTDKEVEEQKRFLIGGDIRG